MVSLSRSLRYRLLRSASRKASRRPRTSSSEDRISELPDGILVSIISLLELGEAVRTSVLSRRWMKVWAHYSGSLDFSDVTPLLSDLDYNLESLQVARSRFVSWVNQVLEAHEGPLIDEFIVRFDFHKGHRHHIDKWLDFALARNVKCIVLDFQGLIYCPDERDYYFLPDYHISNFNASRYRSLTSFSIYEVNVTGEFLESLILNCPLLERLCVEKARCLRNLRVAYPTLKLKFLKVNGCYDMEKLEVVCAPNLCFFYYCGPKIKLDIENAPSLAKVSVSWTACYMNILSSVDSLAKYLSQLSSLHIKISVEQIDQSFQLPAVMSNLKHFHLDVHTYDYPCVLNGAALFAMSPTLHKFTFGILLFGDPSGRELHTGPCVEVPSQSLRELEFLRFAGCAVDTEIALFCIKNAPMLEKLTIDRRIFPEDEDEDPDLEEEYKEATDRAMELKAKLLPSAEFVLI